MTLMQIMEVIGLYNKLNIISDGGHWTWYATDDLTDAIHWVNDKTGEVKFDRELMGCKVTLVRPVKGLGLEVFIES